jgi:transposase InsO family protein
VDDHARIGLTAMHLDARKGSAIASHHAAAAYHARLGIAIRRLLNEDEAFRSKAFVAACRELGIAKRYIRPYWPQTNCKSRERFIQSALKECA